ncbi:MAG: aspartyl protease family protein [Alphaproteobacteria bacterium]|nr:aspartyl protease family protein [Alphaproteobacteria bacterium]
MARITATVGTVMRKAAVAAVAALLAHGLGVGGAAAQGTSETFGRMQAMLRDLGIAVPPVVFSSPAVQRHLDDLARERCDGRAIVRFSQSIAAEGYRREAAGAHVGFSRLCGGHAPSLRAAANIYLGIPDERAAAETASALIALEPQADNGYFLRAIAYDRLGDSARAIDDFVSASELFADKSRISGTSYLAIARHQARLGRPCDAIQAIERWTAFQPPRRESAEVRADLAAYGAKGGCTPAAGRRVEVFAAPKDRAPIRVPASIDAARGSLVVDREASFVVLTGRVAEAAGIAYESEGTVRVRIAGGAIVEGRRGRAQRIVLRSLEVRDVPVVVRVGKDPGEADGIDGRLGQSLLARLVVREDSRGLQISAKNAAAR